MLFHCIFFFFFFTSTITLISSLIFNVANLLFVQTVCVFLITSYSMLVITFVYLVTVHVDRSGEGVTYSRGRANISNFCLKEGSFFPGRGHYCLQFYSTVYMAVENCVSDATGNLQLQLLQI